MARSKQRKAHTQKGYRIF